MQKICACACDITHEGHKCTDVVAEELFRAGNALYAAKNYTGARPHYLRAATEFQHAGAQSRVGVLYWFGRGVTANKSEGTRWWKMASAQGYDSAHSDLGAAFMRGEGVPAADAGEAVRLFTLGAARGQMDGLNNLGYAHSTGLGPLTASKPVALGFYERAGRQGSSSAQSNAGIILYDGKGGVARDFKMAFFWVLLAARGGQAEAKKNLAQAQAQCTGTCRTEAEALLADYKPEDVCTASLFSRTNFCGGRGTPTPK